MNKKILLPILLLIFLPAIAAGIWMLNVTSNRFSVSNVSSVSLTANNSAPVVYTSKSDREFFCDLKDSFESIEPQEYKEDVYTLYKLDFLRIQGDVTYYLCLSADTKNCLAYDETDRWYRIQKEKAEELLLKYNISDVYKYSNVPELKILSDGVEHKYLPQSYDWNYLVADGSYTNSSEKNSVLEREQLSISSAKKFEIYFDVEPDWYSVKIYHDDVIVYDGLLESFSDFTYSNDALLHAEITTEWYDVTTNLYNGTAVYDFPFYYDIPASYSINKNEFSTGELAYVHISNANDEAFVLTSGFTKGTVSARPFASGQLIVVPIPMDVDTGEYNFEVHSEHSSFNIPINVTAKNYENVKVGLIRSESASSYNSALSDFKKTLSDVQGMVLEECYWSNGLLAPIQKYIGDKEQYWVSAPSYGVLQTVDGTTISERSFGVHYIKSVEAQSMPVRAVADGQIAFSGTTEAYGNTVVIEHGYGFKTVYGHLDELSFSVGDVITLGSIIGNAKPSKYSIAGTEFFFAIYVNGEFVNPFNFIEEPKSAVASQISSPIEFLYTEIAEDLNSEYADINHETAFAYAPNSHLEDKTVSEIMNMSIRYNENDLLFSKWLETDNMSVIKYASVDIDGDSNHETVLWLAKEANEYLGFVILHEENETVYFYLLYYRQFYNLKNDGTFSSSGSVANNGIRKISFSGVTYTVKDIAYRESYDDNNISYFVEGKAVSENEFSTYLTKQKEKADVVWNVNLSE